MPSRENIAAVNYQYSESAYGSHHKIINYVGKNKRVLDVGCNKGYLCAEFKKNGCYTVGIESDAESAGMAAQFCDEIITADVEGIENLSYPDNYFDAIVFADILEHLKNPETILLKLKRYLHPQGFIIASLPNIARIDIRLKLILGRFDYQETGIMDKTHVRFFTLYTARKLFKECGYKILHINYTGLLAGLRIFPKCLAFQFIIAAKKA